jgi:hypothetical protein
MVKLKHRDNLLLEPWHIWQVTNLLAVLNALEALGSSKFKLYQWPQSMS